MPVKKTEKKNMIVEINGVVYPLRFGIKFLEEINLQPDGLVLALAGLLEGDVLEIYRLTKAALNTEDTLTDEMIGDYIETDADIDQLVKDFLLILPAMNTTKKIVQNSLPRLKKLQEQSEEMQELALKEVEEELKKAYEKDKQEEAQD